MKILYFTDPHNSDTAPLMRTESYCENILNKQEQLIEPAKKCDLVICGGDVFHQKKTQRISHALINRLMEIYREFPRLYIVPGNHDFDRSVDEILWNPMAILDKLPRVYVVHEKIVQIGGVNLYFFGGGDFFAPYQFEDFARRTPEHRGLKVGVFHVPMEVDDELPFELWDVKKAVADFDWIFLGHLHNYQKVSLKEKIVAPGALSRGVLNIDESLERKICYATVEVPTVGDDIRAKMHPLDVLSVDEIFKMEDKKESIHQQRAVESFVSYIEKLKIPKSMSKEQLKIFIEKQDVSGRVKAEAIRILEELDD